MKLFQRIGRSIDTGLSVTGRSIESGLCKMHENSNRWLLDHPGVAQTLAMLPVLQEKAHSVAWLQTKAQIESLLAKRGIKLGSDAVEG